MEYLLPMLRKKREVDSLIRDTLDKVLVLRFGLSSDAVCLQLDDIVRPLFQSFFWKINRLFRIFVELILVSTWLFIDRQLYKSARDVSRFATVALVDVESEEIQVYLKYFDITFIPSTIFFFNAHHMKMDSGYSTPCNSVFVLIWMLQLHRQVLICKVCPSDTSSLWCFPFFTVRVIWSLLLIFGGNRKYSQWGLVFLHWNVIYCYWILL